MTRTGHIFQISSSAGGVPKLSQVSAIVGPLGLENDQQRNKQLHGGPDRALCLFSLERIVALQQLGHPIFPGAIGENLTLAGLDWEAIRPGVQLRLGPQVRIEITSFATPCQHIAYAFVDAQIQLVSDKANPGWARAYARVHIGGPIKPGDPVTPVDEFAPLP
jgi:MOSC domain-containing protein YiiM